MTDEKQTGLKDAMREIIDLVCDQSFLFRSDVRQMLTEKAVVIIDGHTVMNRPERTRTLCGVWRIGQTPALTRLCAILYLFHCI